MFDTLGAFIGGLGLLLIGMNLMTEGLKVASDSALRDMLATWTNSRSRGLLSGFFITSLVQSSAAVTIATIGFANAGLLTLDRAVWVIYGSNVGTTLTAWVVALIGFELDIGAMALPVVGLGALLKFTGNGTSRGPAGMALVGFGLLFMGIATLKDTFDGIGTGITLPSFEPGPTQVLLYVLVGFVITTLVQSSTAAMVITLSAAQSGLVEVNAAAAVVIGANLGSTVTALISSVGATSTAKRVAWSHVFFNLVTALAAIALLEPLLWCVRALEASLGMMPTVALTLAVFHTAFNVLGVTLMWPISAPMVRWLERRFRTSEDSEASPHYLDKNILTLPLLATDALAQELTRVNQHTIAALEQSLQHNLDLPHSSLDHRVVRKLADDIGHYSVELTRRELTPHLSKLLADLLESAQQYLLVIDIAEDIAEVSRDAQEFFPDAVDAALDDYIASIRRHLDIQNLGKPELNARGSASYDEVELYYRKLKDQILDSATHGGLTMEKVDRLLQYMNQAKRACRQLLKATQRLLEVKDGLQRTVPAPGPTAVTAADPQESVPDTTPERTPVN